MKYYVASGLENSDNAIDLSNLLKEMGHEPAYEWWVHGSVQEESDEVKQDVANKEFDGVINAGIVAILLPGGRGTHTEMGGAIAHL